MAKPKTDFTNIRCHRCGRGDLNSNNAYIIMKELRG